VFVVPSHATLLLLDDLLDLLFAFGILAVVHGVLDLKFKFYTFCCQWTHQGGGEIKWSVSWFDI
jgi:hypothetical protein